MDWDGKERSERQNFGQLEKHAAVSLKIPIIMGVFRVHDPEPNLRHNVLYKKMQTA